MFRKLFAATFGLLGAIAKADGSFSPAEAQLARKQMIHLLAIRNLGRADFDLMVTNLDRGTRVWFSRRAAIGRIREVWRAGDWSVDIRLSILDHLAAMSSLGGVSREQLRFLKSAAYELEVPWDTVAEMLRTLAQPESVKTRVEAFRAQCQVPPGVPEVELRAACDRACADYERLIERDLPNDVVEDVRGIIRELERDYRLVRRADAKRRFA